MAEATLRKLMLHLIPALALKTLGLRGAMPTSDRSSMLDPARRVRKELDALTRQQTKALQDAIYLGMTPDENKQYEERRNKIALLTLHLYALENAG